ncbi:MAG: metal-sensitive transcriptional regulator [Firmicutes bacterium]|nr:metal-sensitive transcriptional regulator [Bacillota bacterium]
MDRCKSSKEDIMKRLRRIEGQVKGIQRMVDEEKYCVDILVQITAVRSAINKVGGIILENHSRTCIKNALKKEDGETEVDELINLVLKFMK